MTKNSEKLTRAKEAFREEALLRDVGEVLTRHGHGHLRIRSMSLETRDDDCGGRPKVPVKVKGPNGEIVTIWVCP